MNTQPEIQQKINIVFQSTETLTTLLKLYHHKINQQELFNLKEEAVAEASRQKIQIQEQLKQIQILIADIETAETNIQKEIAELQSIAEAQLLATNKILNPKSAKAFITETLEKFNAVRTQLIEKGQGISPNVPQSEADLLNELKAFRNNTAHEIEQAK